MTDESGAYKNIRDEGETFRLPEQPASVLSLRTVRPESSAQRERAANRSYA
jgi:hypothetical protein